MMGVVKEKSGQFHKSHPEHSQLFYAFLKKELTAINCVSLKRKSNRYFFLKLTFSLDFIFLTATVG